MKAIRTNCKLLITKHYFKGSFRKPTYDGNSEMWVTVLKHSYGADKGQHTFTCRIDEVVSNEKEEVGKKFRIKGRNLYPNVITHIQGDESRLDSL